MSVKTVQAIVNGQTVNLSYNSSTGRYEATITAPGKSSYSQSGQSGPQMMQTILPQRMPATPPLEVPCSYGLRKEWRQSLQSYILQPVH